MYSGVIKVLIIDDSLIFREAVASAIKTDKRIQVVGTAGNAFDARDKILQLEPDVITLDIEMPQMDGIEFLTRLMPQYPIAALVVSGHGDQILKALEAGAVDFVNKPSNGKEGMECFIQELIVKIKIASMANVSGYKKNYMLPRRSGASSSQISERLIFIGASTGGTEAVFQIIRDLPRQMPGIVVVQHMPEGFTKMYAERLNNACQMAVKEAEDGDLILTGRVLIAPGGMHTKICQGEKGYYVKCFVGDKVNGHRPSVDVLFHTVAELVGKRAIGVLLTGMGYDGAKGLLAMRKNGAITLGQDEESSIVYGMPKVAYDIGAVSEQLALGVIAQKLYVLVKSNV